MSPPWDRRSDEERDRAASLLLDDWLPAATSFSPYWSRRVAELGATPGELDDLAGLRRLHPVRERDVVGAGGPGGPALVLQPDGDQAAARSGEGLWRTLARSIGGRIGGGGSGDARQSLLSDYKPVHVHKAGADGGLVVAYTRSDLDRLHRCGARAASVLGLDTDSYLVSAVPMAPRLRFWGIYHLGLGTSMLALHPRTEASGLDVVLASLALVPTTAVAVPVWEARDLGEAAADRGVDCTGLETVVTVGVPPDDVTRDEIAAAWQRAAGGPVAVRALWGPSAGRAMWAECAAGAHGLHTYPDLEVLEVVDPITGRSTDGPGDLTITSAGWHGTGLLRYQTGVFVEGLVDDPCPGCGRTVPRLVGDIIPRAWQPHVDVGGSLAVLDFRGAAGVLEADDRVEAWRVEISPGERGDRIQVQVATRGWQADDLTERLATAMGVWPTDIEDVGDPGLVRAQAREVGNVFADLR